MPLLEYIDYKKCCICSTPIGKAPSSWDWDRAHLGHESCIYPTNDKGELLCFVCKKKLQRYGYPITKDFSQGKISPRPQHLDCYISNLEKYRAEWKQRNEEYHQYAMNAYSFYREEESHPKGVTITCHCGWSVHLDSMGYPMETFELLINHIHTHGATGLDKLQYMYVHSYFDVKTDHEVGLCNWTIKSRKYVDDTIKNPHGWDYTGCEYCEHHGGFKVQSVEHGLAVFQCPQCLYIGELGYPAKPDIMTKLNLKILHA